LSWKNNTVFTNYDKFPRESECARVFTKMKDFSRSQAVTYIHCKCVNISETMQDGVLVITDHLYKVIMADRI